MTNQQLTDIFASDEFVDKNAQLPPVIVLNDQLHCGYFVTVNNMAKCGWINFDETQLVAHTFGSGATEQGILITSPRMLVCPKTDLYMYKIEEESKTILGVYDSTKKGDPNIKSERIYLVFFLDENNQPLHTTALKYAARGVNGTTFELERRTFKSELEACHAIANNIHAKPKNDLFHSLGVFCFTTKATLAGDKNKAWCCRVESHDKPTIQNWKEYFLGYTELRDYMWQALEPKQKMELPQLMAVEEEFPY